MKRIWLFIGFAVLVVAGTAAYLVMADRDPLEPEPSAGEVDMSEPFIAFRRTSVDSAFRTVGLVPYDDPAAAVSGTELTCERVHLGRAGGICLTAQGDIASTVAVQLLEPDLTTRYELSRNGIPSRARVSADGRWAASTMFVWGHSYADTSFSTQTEIYDLRTGASLGNLEDWRITRQGVPHTAVDTNIWGVTFAPDGNTFYATLGSNDEIHLVRGDVAGRSIEMLEVVAECPSLSPSGELLAYKRATGPGTWQVRVRTLATGAEVVVDDSRSVDDQIEWLDEDRVLYGVYRPDGGATTDVWEAAADGSAPSVLFIPQAWSPAVVR